jgi:hypothetical protein
VSQKEFTQSAKRIQAFLETTSDVLSRTSGFVKRKSKMTGPLFIQTLLLGWLKNPAASLHDLAHRAADLGLHISPQGIAQRFKAETVIYTQALFRESLQQFQNRIPLAVSALQQFNGIYLLDSTHFELPDALKDRWRGAGGCGSGAGLKMQLSFEYLRGNLGAVALQDGIRSDRRYAPPEVPTGSLHLFDLGYFKLETFERIGQAGAFFISRLRSGSVVSMAKGQTPIDLEAFCQQLSGDRHECHLWIGAKARLPVRVIFQRCAPALAEARRRQARAAAKHKGWNCSAKHLALLDWHIFITNVSEQHLSLAQVLQMYRIRWQVELIFKVCKSGLQFDRVQGCGEHRILSQLYLRLILLTLLCHLSAPVRWQAGDELSLPKAWRLLSSYADRLLVARYHHWRTLPHLLANLTEDFKRFGQKTKRKKEPSTLLALVNLGA